MSSVVRCVFLSTATLAAAAFGQDVTRPGDSITPSSPNHPGGEAAPNCIDNSASTKYLNFDRVNTGFTVAPAGEGIVRGINLITANDAPERDPVDFILEGSNDGVDFVEIARGPLTPTTVRFSLFSASFANSTAYTNYRVTFPNTRATSANSMQIAEVQLVTALDITSPADVVTVELPPGSLTGPDEDITKLIDNRLGNKFNVQNALDGNTVITLVPAIGSTVVSAVAIYGANDDTGFPGRTPQFFAIAGSNDGVNYTPIFNTPLQQPLFNFEDQSYSFNNSTAYSRYRITLGSPFNQATLQLGEIELLGTIGSAANDNCNDALPVFNGLNSGSNVNSTAGTTTSSCDASVSRDVWFRYTATSNGPVAVSTCGSELDTVLAVYSSCSAATDITCDNNTCGAGSIVTFNATQGTTYYIRVAGANDATGSFSLVIDNAPIAHEDVSISLPYNFNGMVHAGEGGNPDALDGYRSISDRGLRQSGLPGSIEVGLLGTTGIPYSVVTAAGQLDIVHLGNRNGVSGGVWAFDVEPADGDNVGVQPSWLADPSQEGPHTASLNSGGILRMGSNTQIGVLFHVSNGGGAFDVTLDFYNAPAATVTVTGPDWFGSQNVPAPGLGVAAQRELGVFDGADSVDLGGTGVGLNVVEAIITTQSLIDGGYGDLTGKRLRSISFGNRVASVAGYAIFAASLRDPGCPADIDGSGGVDGDDVIVFFGDWDAGLEPADFDGSGGVDGDDVIAFFARWDSGC